MKLTITKPDLVLSLSSKSVDDVIKVLGALDLVGKTAPHPVNDDTSYRAPAAVDVVQAPTPVAAPPAAPTPQPAPTAAVPEPVPPKANGVNGTPRRMPKLSSLPPAPAVVEVPAAEAPVPVAAPPAAEEPPAYSVPPPAPPAPQVVPPVIADAKSLRTVLIHIIEQENIHGVDAIHARCVELKPHVSLLGSLDNFDKRIKQTAKALDVAQAESEAF